MRKTIIMLTVVAASCGLTLHFLSANPDTAVRADAAYTSASLVPVDDKPLNRTPRGRIVSFADMLEDVTPAVVAVYPSRIVRQYTPDSISPLEDLLRRYYGIPVPPRAGQGQPEERLERQGLGSGVIVSPDGYILTNHHVISDQRGMLADSVEVALSDDRTFVAQIVGGDAKTDIAVLKVDADDLPHLPMADSKQLRVGDIVFAVGNPLEVGLTVTQGIVSAMGRRELRLLGMSGYEDFIQTDASINPGNSGGPLVDAEGRIVGINTAILSRTGGNIGIGFAIPSHLARVVMEKLIDTGSVQRGFLGVTIDDLTPELAEAFGMGHTDGALIQDVVEGFPAAEAGIKPGDVVTSVGATPIASASDLRLTISEMDPGASVELGIMREGRPRKITVILGSLDGDIVTLPGSGQGELLEGVAVAPVSREEREAAELPEHVDGLIIKTVKGTSPYSKFLNEGMVIVSINDTLAIDLKSAQEALRKGINKFRVFDNGSQSFIALRVE